MGATAADINDIKRLREETGAGIMEAKKALQDAGGDFDKARLLLEQRGAANAAKRAGKEAAQGLVEAYIHAGGQIGVLVELNCETDFVARTPEFKELAREIALQIAAMNPLVVSGEDLPESEKAAFLDHFREEAIKEGKKEQFVDKIAQGKLDKHLKTVALLDQEYIRDGSKTVKNLIDEVSGKTRENVKVRRFSRFQIGA